MLSLLSVCLNICFVLFRDASQPVPWVVHINPPYQPVPPTYCLFLSILFKFIHCVRGPIFTSHTNINHVNHPSLCMRLCLLIIVIVLNMKPPECCLESFEKKIPFVKFPLSSSTSICSLVELLEKLPKNHPHICVYSPYKYLFIYYYSIIVYEKNLRRNQLEIQNKHGNKKIVKRWRKKNHLTKRSV